MGKTLAEKIIGSHAKKDVSAGQIALVGVDVCLTQDGTGPLAIRQLQKINLESKRDGFQADLEELQEDIAALTDQIEKYKKTTPDPKVEKLKKLILDRLALTEKGREIRQRLNALRRVEAEFLSSPASFDLGAPGAAVSESPGPVQYA